MRSLIVMEIKKALGNKWFLIALVIGLGLAVHSAVGNGTYFNSVIYDNLSFMQDAYISLSLASPFNLSLIADFNQPTTDLFFLVLPLLAVIPYSWSLASEEKSGYFQQVVTRCSRRHYFTAKSIATFLSGALVITIPVIVNFIILACVFPFYVPDVMESIYHGVFLESIWSDLYYTMPFAYFALYWTVVFVFSGLWAAFVSAVSHFLKNRVALLIVPYLLLQGLYYLDYSVFVSLFDAHVDITPFVYLRSAGDANILLIIGEFLILFCFVLSVVKAKRTEDLV